MMSWIQQVNDVKLLLANKLKSLLRQKGSDYAQDSRAADADADEAIMTILKI